MLGTVRERSSKEYKISKISLGAVHNINLHFKPSWLKAKNQNYLGL